MSRFVIFDVIPGIILHHISEIIHKDRIVIGISASDLVDHIKKIVFELKHETTIPNIDSLSTGYCSIIDVSFRLFGKHYCINATGDSLGDYTAKNISHRAEYYYARQVDYEHLLVHMNSASPEVIDREKHRLKLRHRDAEENLYNKTDEELERAQEEEYLKKIKRDQEKEKKEESLQIKKLKLKKIEL